jgi:hypothetical protein
MSLSKKLFAAAAPALMLMLSACATGFPAQVSRFQAMPAPQGQSFIVQPPAGREAGLESTQYANLVRQHLMAQGYSEAPSADEATLIVTMNYGVDEGREEIVRRPVAMSRFHYDPFFWDPRFRHHMYRSRFGLDPFYRPYWSRFGYAGRVSPFYYGWNDPFWYAPHGFGYDDLRSYTVYRSELDLVIRRAADGQTVFEGQAQARSRTDELTTLVPNLVEAMFTDFPGKSGQTVRITVPPAPRQN